MDPNVQKQLHVFLENIVFLRKQHKLSKKKMAEILGIGIGTLNRIEKGELPTRISTRVIFRIKDHFHLSPSEQFHTLSQ